MNKTKHTVENPGTAYLKLNEEAAEELCRQDLKAAALNCSSVPRTVLQAFTHKAVEQDSL